jgi:acetyl-CoA carboxylase carboxyltransferase component
VPVVGVVHGRCFAGNAALLGCCDVIIATRRQQHRHGRPGHDRRRRPGRLQARQIGPADVQHANGVIDVLVDDEAHAVVGQAVPVATSRAARRLDAPTSACCAGGAREPPARLRHARRHHRLVETGSVLELRRGSARHPHGAGPHRRPAGGP